MAARGVSSVLILLTAAAVFHPAESEWNYIRGDEDGPANWRKSYPSCGGTSNSPIDLKDAENKQGSPWELTRWDTAVNWQVEDNKHSVVFTPNMVSDGGISTEGGDLGNSYDLEQFHFHWAMNNEEGSEHTVDGKSYPLEAHFVHKKSKYSTLSDALDTGEADAAAVLAFFFKIQDQDNPDLDDLINGISQAKQDGTVAEHRMGPLTKFAGKPLAGDYWRYMGGLTTPGCNEQVVWTLFTTPIPISDSQMSKFRQWDGYSKGRELYRPTQPLGDRQLILYAADNSSGNIRASALVSFIAVLITTMIAY